MVAAKKAGDAVAIADGRSDSARNQIRDWLKSAIGDDVRELLVVYEMETALGTDVRNPKRKKKRVVRRQH